MSQFFSTRYLRYSRSARKGVITRDEPCRSCEYNLRGLEFGSLCPECGAPIQIPEPVRDSITDAPHAELRRLRAGLILAMIALPPMFLAFPIGAGFAATGSWFGPLLGAVPMAMWIAAVWIITTPMSAPGGQRRGFVRVSRLRIAARRLQLCLPLSLAMLALAIGGPATGRTTLVLAIGLSVITAMGGLVGIAILAVLLACLAEWGQNDFGVRLFDWAVWGLAVCTGLLLLVPVNALFKLFSCASSVFWLGALACFFFGLAEMMRTCHWALRHAHERVERSRAVRAKMGQTHATHPDGENA